MNSESSATGDRSPEYNGTPLDTVFEPIDIEDMEEEYERLRLKPLPAGRYKVGILGYEISESGPNSKVPGTPMVRFHCHVVEDSDSVLNGRKIQSQRYMLRGGGFIFFLRLAKAVVPQRLIKKSVRLLEPNGKSQYLDSFTGCTFIANVSVDHDADTGAETGYNSVDSIQGA